MSTAKPFGCKASRLAALYTYAHSGVISADARRAFDVQCVPAGHQEYNSGPGRTWLLPLSELVQSWHPLLRFGQSHQSPVRGVPTLPRPAHRHTRTREAGDC
eukprot:scaffold96282_cov29-Tisochrysis_lutea.AAC.2